jgi:hypothetical protein
MSLTTLSIIAGAITSITVIIGCVIKIYKLARNVENKIEAYDKNLAALNLHLNKMALLNTDLPLIDRLHAGEKYLAGGGNGFGKKVYDQLLHDLDTSVWGNTTWAESQYRSYKLKKEAEELETHEYIKKKEEIEKLKAYELKEIEEFKKQKGDNNNA